MLKEEKTCGEVVARRTPVADQEGLPDFPRYESLTLWRGIACLLIVVYHSSLGLSQEVTGLTAVVFAVVGKFWIGVPLFFVISGYCITASADELRRRNGAARHFFWRRFRRIYPPYWAAFALTALFGFLGEALVSSASLQGPILPVPRGLTAWQWLGNLTLTETWLWHFAGGAENLFLPHAWTLCYEEQFYLLIGLVLIPFRRFFFPVLGFLTLIVAALYVFPQPGLYLTGLFLDGHWLMFASGILVYQVSNRVPPSRRIWFGIPLVLGILHAVPDLQQLRLQHNQAYLAAFSFALLIMGLKGWDGYLANSRVLSPLRRCGEMCFSLYLVHWPVAKVVGHALDSLGADGPVGILLIRIPASVTMSILVSIVFFRLIERRFWKPRIPNRETESTGGA